MATPLDRTLAAARGLRPRGPGPGASPATAVVVGGGIAGLTAALRLAEAGRRVTVLEAGPRVGGKIRTERADGFLVEAGPDSFLTARPGALALCRELGLAGALIEPLAPRTVFLWRGGRLERFPDGTLGVPSGMRALLGLSQLSRRDRLRAALDLVLPRGGVRRDESAGSLLRRRFGDALVDVVSGPLLEGIYGARVDELSVEALLPQLREAERRHRSVMIGLRDAPSIRDGSGDGAGPDATDTPTPPVLSLRDGMETLVVALTNRLRDLRVEIRTNARVAALERTGGRWTLRLDGGRSIEGSDVVLAVPAPAAARLVAAQLPGAARRLKEIVQGSTATVSLAYDARSLPRPLSGHGFLGAGDPGLHSTAMTWTSSKWPGRAPEGSILVRLSLPALAGPDRSDADLLAAAREDVETTIGAAGEPVLVRSSRFEGDMPRYTVGHRERVDAVFDAVEALPGLRLAGAAYRGVGIPDCIASGEAAAADLLERARA